MEPNHQLHQVAASADNNWSSTKSTQRRVNSSSTQSSIPPNEMSQLEHMQNPVSTQYITRQQEGGDEYWRQEKAPLPNNDDAAEVVTDTTESTMAEGEFVLAELRAELLAEIATDTNTESTMAEDNNQPRAEDYTNDDHIGNFVLPTSRADPGFANSEDNTLVLGDSSEIYDMEIDDDGNPKKTVYKPILFPSGASLRDLCTLKINALQTSLFCHCIAFHIHQIPLMKSYKLEHHQRVYQCMCGEYRLKMKSVDRKIRGNLRDFTLDLTYGKQVIIINKEVTKLFHTFGTTCTCDRRSTPIEPALLATMPTYQRWIRKAMHPLTKDYTFQDIKDKLADLNQIVAFKKTSYSNILASVTNYLCHLISEEYKYLPRFLQTLYQCNVETVSVALQVDSEHRFCRWFHGFPIAKYHGVLTQPPYIVDCFHSKSKMYSGRIFLFASRTGFGRTVIEAIAYIPSESAGHICWLVQMCWRHGMHLEDAIFTDQGPFLSAMNSLNLEFLVNFYVMLCLQHIFRNIQDGFTVLFAFEEEKKLFRSMMNAASFCEDQLTFFKLIFDYLHLKITSCPGKNRHLYITLVLYILRLHPGLWTVFANAPKFDHGHYIHYLRNYILPSLFSSLFINLNFRSNEHMEMEHAGKFLLECRASAQKNTDDFLHKFHNFIHRKQGPCPRFHLARTNTAESQGASFLFCGFRYEPPPIGIPIILKQYNHQIDQLKLDLVRMGRTASYTTTGARLRAVAIDRGFVFDPAYLNFSGAGVANNNTSVDGSHESSNQGCALELLSSNDDVSSHGSCVDSSGYIPQQTQSQSQSSQAGIPADIYPAGGLGTFPTSQTTTNTEEETVAGDDLDTNVGFSFSPTQPPALNPLSRPRLDSDGESVRSQSAENIQIDQEDESFASDDEYARGSDVASDDDGSSTHSFASDAEMTNNTMREAAIVGNFKSIDGRQYDVELNWQYPNIEDYKNQNYKNQKFDPAYTHLCNFCVLNSAMVKFPCHCILRLAQNAAEFDDRFPQHHKREVIKGELPDEFYPRCFLSKRNLELILSASCVLKVRIPTQDLVNKYPVVEPYCKGPPQYRAIIERGYRYTSTGETGASKKKTKAHGHENNKQPKKQKFANCHTESVKVSAPIGEFGKAAKVASREFVHDPELSQSILESNLGKAGQRLCGNCNLPGHTYNQCSAMYSQGEGVVKPKMIVTGKYLVYSVQDENPDSRLRLDKKPTELSAVSSKDLNSRMFLSYRPEEDPKSDEAEQKKKVIKYVQGKPDENMSMKFLKKKFARQVKDISDETIACKVPINKQFAMAEWLINNAKVNTEDDFVDTYDDTDFNRANILDALLLENKTIGCGPYNALTVPFGSQTSLSETEWVMLSNFKLADKSREALNAYLLLNKGKISETVFRLAKKHGTTKFIEYIERRTLAKFHPERAAAAAGVAEVIDLCEDDVEQSKGILCLFSQVEDEDEDEDGDEDEDKDEDEDEDEDDVDDTEVTAKLKRQSGSPSAIGRMERRELQFERLLVVTDSDLKTLKPGVWLNDIVISSYLFVLRRKEKDKNLVRDKNLVIFQPTYFIVKLLGFRNDSYNYQQVHKEIKNKNFLNAEVIYIPINVDQSHWILCCIHPTKCRIDIFDSMMGDDDQRDQRMLKKFGLALLYMMEDLTKSLRLPFDINTWTIRDGLCPQQSNYHDCGVSVCLIALFKSEGRQLDYTTSFLENPQRRVEIKDSILEKEIRTTTTLPPGHRSPANRSIPRRTTLSDFSNDEVAFTITSRYDLSSRVNPEEPESDNSDNKSNINDESTANKPESDNSDNKSNINDESTANKTKKNSSSSCRSSNDEEITHDVVFKAQNLGLYIIAVPTTCEIIIAAVSNDHKDECFPGDVLISAEGTGFHASGSAGNPNVKDATKFLKSSKRPLTIRIKRGQPRHREYVAAFHLEQVEYKNSHPKQPPIVTNEKEEKKVASPKRKQLPHSLGSESSNSSTYSFSPPEESDDSHDAKKPKKMVDLHADDTIQLMFAGWGSEKSVPFRILSISEEGIDLGISTPITKNAKIAITEHGSKSISTSKLEVYRDFNEYTLHHGSVDGVYLADRNRQRIEKTCATNQEELKISWAMGDSTTQSQLVESKENENISAPRRLFPESSSTAERAYDRGGGYTDFQSANRLADNDKFHGDNSCKVCHLPYLEFCSIGRYPGVHAKAYSGNRLWSGSVWCCPCFKKKEDMEQEEDDQRKLQEQRQERQAMRRINEAMRARKAKHRKHWQTMRRFMK